MDEWHLLKLPSPGTPGWLKPKEVAGQGPIGWLVTKHPTHLSEGQPTWIVMPEAFWINGEGASGDG